MSKRRTQSKSYIPFTDDTPAYQPPASPNANASPSTVSPSSPYSQGRSQGSTSGMNPFRDPAMVQAPTASGHSATFFPRRGTTELFGQTNPYGSQTSAHMSAVSMAESPNVSSPHLLLGMSSGGSSNSDHSFENSGASESRYNLFTDPNQHAYHDFVDDEEPDRLHDMHAKDEDSMWDCTLLSLRGWLNVLGMLLIAAALIALFAGYPIASYFSELAAKDAAKSQYGWNVGGTNSSGQVPEIQGFHQLVDKDTPDEVKHIRGFDGHEYTLVFSDEFEQEGRSFFEGDDPFWEAQDFHYWGTNDLEWYDPDAITTANGSLVITMTHEPIHDLNYRSGMLQSWNKFCFTGGIIEISASLPGSPNITGLWPGAWTMGNLGRAGFGATTDGMWPYSYDSCDVGTRPNQTNNAGTAPEAALTTEDKNADERYQIDIIEAEISYIEETDTLRGAVSQSAQFAPFNAGYHWNQNVSTLHTDDCHFNEYEGGVFQQAASAQAYTDRRAYEATEGRFSVYGFEWEPGTDDEAHVTWITNGTQAWTMTADSVGPDEEAEISQRVISEEAHYIILNLGMSPGFQPINFAELIFPTKYLIDYVRVYQRKDRVNVGCSPKNMPTHDYIQDHINAYTNPNLTLWEDAGYAFPRSSMDEGGC